MKSWNKMKLQTAIEILEYHQEWRLGKKEDMLTDALDILLNEVKNPPYRMTELEFLDKKTEEYIQDGINWDAHRNEAIISANKSELARGDIEQLASDSFQEGWFAAKSYFEGKK